MAVDCLGDAVGYGDGQKQADGKGVAASQFEHHNRGGDWCTKNGGRDPAHAEDGVEPFARGHFRKEACSDDAKGTAGHGAEIQGGGKHPATEARGERYRGCRGLGNQEP